MPDEVEAARVVPVIAGILAARPDARVSVDTRKASVARAALAAGARLVNDVSGLADPAMAATCAAAGAGLALMHLRGDPRTMQQDTRYTDLIGEICAFLSERAQRAVAAGVRELYVDPGIGFGKASADNPALIAAIPRFAALGWPVLIGASRKRFIGELTGVAAPAERVAGSLGAALAAAARGAALLRVHDVAATRQALDVFVACGGLPA